MNGWIRAVTITVAALAVGAIALALAPPFGLAAVGGVTLIVGLAMKREPRMQKALIAVGVLWLVGGVVGGLGRGTQTHVTFPQRAQPIQGGAVPVVPRSP